MEDRPGRRFRAGGDRGLCADRLARLATPAAELADLATSSGGVVALLALAEIVHLLRNDVLSRLPCSERSRDFYGVLTVTEERSGPPLLPIRSLFHGGTLHGMQFTDPELHQHRHDLLFRREAASGQTLDYYQQASARSRRTAADRSGRPGRGNLGRLRLPNLAHDPLLRDQSRSRPPGRKIFHLSGRRPSSGAEGRDRAGRRPAVAGARAGRAAASSTCWCSTPSAAIRFRCTC